MNSDTPRWVVMKFGGTSVSTAERWGTIAERCAVERSAGRVVLLVVSALAGVTDLLQRLSLAPPPEVVDELLQTLDARHRELARTSGIIPGDAYSSALRQLRALLADPAASGLVGPAWMAQVQSFGERFTTALGVELLSRHDQVPQSIDVLDLLTADLARTADPLNAQGSGEPDPELARSLAHQGDLFITQGFQVRGPEGKPWLLGRGGSDTSAALLAARLQAEELQIWTDVPGVFSADPAMVPEARLLRRLSYSEAQEFAAMGAKVLHPPCIEPLRRHAIPLSIRDTNRPNAEHTAIGPRSAATEGLVKGVISRGDITLISLETVAMWHQPGFLADIFAEFKTHQLSVDLVSTSESSVTVSLDPRRPGAGSKSGAPGGLDACLAALARHGEVTVKTGLVSVSLVGNAIRTLLGRLSDALDLFQDRTIHLVTQSANDLNLTLVVDAEQSERLVQKLHGKLIAPVAEHRDEFGSSWSELVMPKRQRHVPWWDSEAASLRSLAQEGPAYVYHLRTVRQAAGRLLALNAVQRVLYAVKANGHPEILRTLHSVGVHFECVSPGEVEHVLASVPGTGPESLLFTPNFAPRAEYAWALAHQVPLTVDNLYPLEAWPDLFDGHEIFLRLDLDAGHGHHRKVVTAGDASKFGIPLHQLDRVRVLCERHRIRITGLHAHTGSGVGDPDVWRQQLARFLELLPDFPDVRVIDLGGGLGVPERRDQAPFDLAALDRLLTALPVPESVDVWLEPGRYLVAEAGVLIARVSQLKSKGSQAYLGVDVGMNSLLRPALYGAYHDIVNLNRQGQPATHRYTVVGPICETGDVLGERRFLPESREGDVMLIANAGAYGRVMASDYNRRPPARELVLPED